MAGILDSITTEEYMEMIPRGMYLNTRNGNERVSYKEVSEATLAEGKKLKLYTFEKDNVLIQLSVEAVYEHFALEELAQKFLRKSLTSADMFLTEKEFLNKHHLYLLRKLTDGTSEE